MKIIVSRKYRTKWERCRVEFTQNRFVLICGSLRSFSSFSISLFAWVLTVLKPVAREAQYFDFYASNSIFLGDTASQGTKWQDMLEVWGVACPPGYTCAGGVTMTASIAARRAVRWSCSASGGRSTGGVHHRPRTAEEESAGGEDASGGAEEGAADSDATTEQWSTRWRMVFSRTYETFAAPTYTERR